MGGTGKETIEMTRGKWIIECSELTNMRRAGIEEIKSQLSRQVDRGRMAYDRVTIDVPRQWVSAGTTNDQEYLKDQTGNRRFLPIKNARFDPEQLALVRDQLWAEAAHLEALRTREGRFVHSIRLAKELWPLAAEEQKQRTTENPWTELLRDELMHHCNDEHGPIGRKISNESLWAILDMRPGNRSGQQGNRLNETMRALGWERPNKGGVVSIKGDKMTGWVHGKSPWYHLIFARSDRGQLTSETEDPPSAQGNLNLPYKRTEGE
jgi:putative DNA primase/helicase